jgi:hypothetical protein
MIRFHHLFTEPDLSIHQWEPNVSFDEEFSRLKQYLSTVDDTDIFEDFFCKHWLYCAATAPIWTMGSEWEEFMALLGKANAGDIIEVWTLNEKPEYFCLKCPDENGLFPKRGAY